MATTIKTKNSITASTAPTGLVQGELAVNITDKKLYVGDAVGNSIQIAGQGATNGAGGSNTQVQYNSSGALVGSSNMTFNGTGLTLANDASISGLTVGKGANAQSENTALGISALAANNTGNDNTGIGYYALLSTTNGGQNTAVGAFAMRVNTTGAENSAYGYIALRNNTTGNYNTGIGNQALYNNTTASNNTAVGYQALYDNTTGATNTAIGQQAGQRITGGANTAVGQQALQGTSGSTGNYNSALGSAALSSISSGSSNVAIGYGAAPSNTTGSYNVAVGQQALNGNTTAGFNTATGYQAGYSSNVTSGNAYLVYNGYRAGYSQTTALYSTMVGAEAGYNSTTGNANTFLGQGSGYYVTTGAKNTFVGCYNGNQAGLNLTTASNYIVLSDGDGNPTVYWDNQGTGKTTASATDFYSFRVLNSQATRPYGLEIKFTGATPNNTTQDFLECSDSTNTKLFIYSNGTVSNRTGTYNTISDAKLKENIVDATPKLDKLMQTRVVNYNLIGDELKQIGFVAQELETVFPSLVDSVPDLDENKQPTGEVTKGVKLTVMIPILVKAIQELKAEVDSLKQQLGK